MKNILKFLPLVFAVATAQADIIIEQKMESQFMNGTMTTKMKGDWARIDMPAVPGAGSVSMIVDGSKGEITTLMEAQKMAMKMNGADIKKAAEAGGKKMPDIQKPKATGQKEKVGEYDAEIFETEIPESGKVKMWVAVDFPRGKEIMEQMKNLYKKMPQGNGGLNPGDMDLPGMVVKTEMESPQGKMSVTLVAVKEETIPDDVFTVPAGYNEMQMPDLSGLGK